MGLGMLGGMAAALGAGADGYSAGMDRGRKLKQEDEDRAFQADQRTRMKEQQDREKQVRDAIDKASKDFTVEPMPGEAKPTTMDNRDVGATGEQALQPGGYRAGSMTYATQGEAQAAATASAAPTARMERVAGAMERNGDAVGGMKMRNVMQQQKVGDLQLKAGELQLKQGERKEANDAWDDQSKTALRKAGPEGFAQFLTDSKGDNADGAAQFKATRSPDGKTWRIDMVGPNGELIPRTQEFTNDARGFAEAHVLFSMGVPETQKLAHYVAQQNADTQAGYRKDQADNMREQRKLQERQLNINQQLVNQKGPTAPVIEPFDTKLARDTAHDAVRAENKRRGDNNQPLMTGQEAALMADDFVNAQQVQHGNRQVLIAASNALGRVAPDSPEYAQVYARVLSKGDPKELAAKLAAMGFANPNDKTKPPPGESSRDKAIAPQSPAGGASGGTKSADATPSAPGPVSRFFARMSDLGVDYTSESGKAKLAARINEAKQGGAALTETEALRAQQAGLI